MVNRTEIYGFKLAEGLSAFERQSCYSDQLFLHLNLVRSQCLQNYWGHFLRYHQIERTFRYRHGLLN